MEATLNLERFRADERIALSLRAIYESYGYRPYKMSKFEEYDLYSANIDFLGEGGVLTFNDVNGKLMALKPDVTLSIVKNSKGNKGTQKVHYRENVYRRTARFGGFRELHQSGIECIGDIGKYETAEVLLLALKSLEATGCDFRLDISHFGIITELIGDGISEDIKHQLFTCIKRKNVDGIKELTVKYALDVERFESLAYALSLNCSPSEMTSLLSGISYLKDSEALSDLNDIVSVISDLGYVDKVGIDLSVVNDMNYYRSLIFRGYIDCVPEAILFGGRYDDLVKKMGRDAGALGFAVALDRLQDIKSVNIKSDTVLIVYTDGVSVQSVMSLSEKLRKEGVTVKVSSEKDITGEYSRIFYLTPDGVTEENNA